MCKQILETFDCYTGVPEDHSTGLCRRLGEKRQRLRQLPVRAFRFLHSG